MQDMARWLLRAAGSVGREGQEPGQFAQRPKCKHQAVTVAPSAAGAAPGDPGKAQGRGPGAAGGTMRAIAIAILRPLREIYMFYYHVYYI